MKVIEKEKLIIDDLNLYESHNNKIVTVVDEKIALEILESYSGKGFSIKGRMIQEDNCKIIKNYKIEKTETVDINPNDENLEFRVGPLGQEDIGPEEYVLPGDRKYLTIIYDEIVDS
ncbi:MAG: hypothetical protein LBM26_00715 [Methanobrevibacter sp.]|jgi:hypothetical protein|nr:hypothetical protein [Methanobrevibacter sp.]